MTWTTVPFHDPIHPDANVRLVIDGNTVGVEHPECDTLADVSVHLDAFYCTTCGWNGRVSGAWVMAQYGFK